MLRTLLLLFVLLVAGCDGKGSPSAPTPPDAPTTSVDVHRPTHDVGRYRGWLTGLWDSAGRPLWGSALPGAPAEVRQEWYALWKAHGATHVAIGPFVGGPTYPGVSWSNPDWLGDPAAVRALLVEMLDAGLTPVIFLDGDSARPSPWLGQAMHTVSQALDGIGPQTWSVLTWESEWSRADTDARLGQWLSLSQGSLVAWHGPQGWQAGDGFDRDEFWRLPWGAFLFQSLFVERPEDLHCAYGRKDCWQTSARQVAAYFAGTCVQDVPGGLGSGQACRFTPSARLVFFEATAYGEFRGWYGRAVWGPQVMRVFADMCSQYGTHCDYGQAQP